MKKRSRHTFISMLAIGLGAIFLAGCTGVVSQGNPNGSADAPAIMTQPTSQTVTAGQTATFTVVANGTAPLTYQWQKNGSNIGGATAPSYTTPATTTADNGSTFSVVVTNSKGTVASSAATLTVNTAAVPPTITTQPTSQTVTAGQTATFTVVANGTAPLSYQWQKNGSNIGGATAPSYTTPATTTADNGSTFSVVVTNSKGSVTSNAATLTVNAAAVAPTIVTQPLGLTVTVGQTATFLVVASGTAPLSYQWQKNGSNITGATSSSYTTPATATSDSGSTFSVLVSNSAGSVSSSAATLTVNSGSQKTYSTTFPLTENPISEGNWIGGQSAGGNLWGNIQTNGGLAFGVSEPTQFGDPTAILTLGLGPDQMASATVKINSTPTSCCHEVELRLRSAISNNSITGYEVVCSIVPSQPYIQVVRWNGPNGSFTYINNTGSSEYCVNGDVLMATMIGNTISVYKNGILKASAIDSTFPTGNPGIGFYDNFDSNWSNFGFSSFSAQDNVVGPIGASTPAATQALMATAGPTAANAADLTAVAAPKITSQPTTVSVVTGSTATFSVTASGMAPLTYQWQKNGTDISGATGASYTTPGTTLSDNGAVFTVVVGNTEGSVTSNIATLKVSPGAQKTYSTSFPLMEDPISERGSWINGESLGLDWVNVRTTRGLASGTGSGSAPYADSTAVLAGSWNPDQTAQATVYLARGSESRQDEVELRLRNTVNANVLTGYAFKFGCASDGSQSVRILRWDNGSGWTEIGAHSEPGLHDGDVVKATAIGNTLTAFINGIAVVSVTDGTYTGGNPGIGFYNGDGAGANNNNFGFINFTATEVIGPIAAKSAN
jgi:beta-galactosidase